MQMGKIMKQLHNRPAIKDAVAVILTDSERRIQWVNDDFTNITGYTFEDVIGQKPSILQGRNTTKSSIEHIRKGLESLTPFKADIVNYRKDGEEYLCRLVIHPIFNIDDELTNFIAFEVDGDKTDDRQISLMQIRRRYHNSGLDNLKEIELFAKLTILFERQKIYLNPNLKLGDIAKKLKTNSKYLSQVVNNQTNNNLIHYVNLYRIEEAKRKIISDEYLHLTTYGVAQTCGFKNKSTFYKVFKEITTMTPKDYIRLVKSHDDI
jgi:PAS domain S-box-containing protein